MAALKSDPYEQWLETLPNATHTIIDHLDPDADFYRHNNLPIPQEDRKQMLVELASKKTEKFTYTVMDTLRKSDNDGFNTTCLRYWITYLQHNESTYEAICSLIVSGDLEAIDWRWTNPWTYNREYADARSARRDKMTSRDSHFDFLRESIENKEVPDEILVYTLRRYAYAYRHKPAKALVLHDHANELIYDMMDDYATQMDIDIASWKHPPTWIYRSGREFANAYLDTIVAFLQKDFRSDYDITRQDVFSGIPVDVTRHFNSPSIFRGSPEKLRLFKTMTRDQRLTYMKKEKPLLSDKYCARVLDKIQPLIDTV